MPRLPRLLKNSKILAILLTVSSMATLSTAAYAAPAVPHYSLCSQLGVGLCISTGSSNPRSGTYLKLEPTQQSTRQNMKYLNANVCSGSDKVTSTCPFSDHALDRKWRRHSLIVRIKWVNYPLCVGSFHDAFTISAKCNANGTVWVENNDQLLINVHQSNNFHESLYLCSTGVRGDDPSIVGSAGHGLCEWARVQD